MIDKAKFPTKGICPIASFDQTQLIEDDTGKFISPPITNTCYVPALYMKEGTHPSESCFIDCAAVDTRSSYLNCQHWQFWFWQTVAKNIAVEIKNKEGQTT